MAEAQYVEAYSRLKTEVAMPECAYGDAGDGGVKQDVDVKVDLDEVKQRVDNIVTELCELRVQVHKLKMTTMCVGVAFGCVKYQFVLV
jgi:hypothetical protein